MVKKPVDELRKDINLGAIYVLLHVAAEIGRFYTIPLGQVTKACLQITQEILPPAMSNVFNNVTARAASQPSKADGVFLTVRNALAKHPLKQGMSEEDKSSAVYFLNHLNLHVRRTALGIWPNGSGWRPNEASNASSTAFPRFHGVLKVREAMRRLTDPPSVEEMAIERDLLASDAAYSPLLQEIFLPPSLRRAPVLYSGDVPVEFNMGTVGVLLGMQLVRASAPSPNGSHEWYDKNVGAFGTLCEEVQDEGDRIASRRATAGPTTRAVLSHLLAQDSPPCGQRLLRRGTATRPTLRPSGRRPSAFCSAGFAWCRAVTAAARISRTGRRSSTALCRS
ncbi:hypothetical protein MTO96_039734 [Rhipicephalus appendiculatus]